MIRVFYKNADCAVLVYDITRKETFEKLNDWLLEVKENAAPNAKICLVGNQKDNESRREVDNALGKGFADKNGLTTFFETSAKTGEGVAELFLKVCELLYIDNLGKKPKRKKKKEVKKLVKDRKDGKQSGCC